RASRAQSARRPAPATAARCGPARGWRHGGLPISPSQGAGNRERRRRCYGSDCPPPHRRPRRPPSADDRRRPLVEAGEPVHRGRRLHRTAAVEQCPPNSVSPGAAGRPEREDRTVNKVLLTGRLTRDPELRVLASGKSVCTFNVATNEYAGNGK